MAERNAKKKLFNFLSSETSWPNENTKKNCPKTTKLLTLYEAGDKKKLADLHV